MSRLRFRLYNRKKLYKIRPTSFLFIFYYSIYNYFHELALAFALLQETLIHN